MIRKWLDTLSVIPAKTGNQQTFLWIPLPRKGRKDVRLERILHNSADVKRFKTVH